MSDRIDPPAPDPGAPACACAALPPGLPRFALTDFACIPGDTEARVAAMGAAFGLSVQALRRDPGAWLDLLAVCAACPRHDACARSHDAPALRALAEGGLCPSAAAFAALARAPRR